MTNAPIILRLRNENDEPVQLDVHRLSEFVTELSRAFSITSRVSLGDRAGELPSDVAFLIVAPPRSGSLEIVFQPIFELNVDVNVLVAVLPDEMRANALSVLSDAASIGSFLLAAVTVWYSKWRRPDTNLALQPAALEALREQLQSGKTGDQRITAQFKSLRRAAFKLGVAEVEISVDESLNVTIVDGAERKRTIAIGSSAEERDKQTVPAGAIQRTTEAIDVEFEGRSYKAFAGLTRPQSRHDREKLFVVLWGSENPLPRDREFAVVQYRSIDPDTISAGSDILPPEFENAVGAILATASQGFR